MVRGANAPAIIKTIQEQLEHETKVLKGEAERKPIKASFLVEKSASKSDEDNDNKQHDADNTDAKKTENHIENGEHDNEAVRRLCMASVFFFLNFNRRKQIFIVNVFFSFSCSKPQVTMHNLHNQTRYDGQK